jgi:hypothetical protein
MAKYRGSKGDLKVSTNSIANLRDWEATISRAYIDGMVMGSAAKTGSLDIPGATGRLRPR